MPRSIDERDVEALAYLTALKQSTSTTLGKLIEINPGGFILDHWDGELRENKAQSSLWFLEEAGLCEMVGPDKWQITPSGLACELKPAYERTV